MMCDKDTLVKIYAQYHPRFGRTICVAECSAHINGWTCINDVSMFRSLNPSPGGCEPMWVTQAELTELVEGKDVNRLIRRFSR